MEFFTADLHLFHENVIAFCERPFTDVQHMHEEIVERWNEAVAPSDTVYVLGDVSFANKEKTYSVISRLHGRKVLGLGNHDFGRSVTWWKDVGFSDIRKGLFVVGGYRCQHFPEVDSMFKYDNRDSLLKYGAPSDSTPLLHGHVHRSWKRLGQQLNIGVDVWDFTPISIDMVDAVFSKTEEA